MTVNVPIVVGVSRREVWSTNYARTVSVIASSEFLTIFFSPASRVGDSECTKPHPFA